MSDFMRVISSLTNTAAFIGCLWWANSALRQMAIPRRLNLSASLRLPLVLAVGALIFSPLSRVLNGLFALFSDYYLGWIKAAEVIGALAVLGFVGWLYSKAILEP